MSATTTDCPICTGDWTKKARCFAHSNDSERRALSAFGTAPPPAPASLDAVVGENGPCAAPEPAKPDALAKHFDVRALPQNNLLRVDEVITYLPGTIHVEDMGDHFWARIETPDRPAIVLNFHAGNCGVVLTVEEDDTDARTWGFDFLRSLRPVPAMVAPAQEGGGTGEAERARLDDLERRVKALETKGIA